MRYIFADGEELKRNADQDLAQRGMPRWPVLLTFARNEGTGRVFRKALICYDSIEEISARRSVYDELEANAKVLAMVEPFLAISAKRELTIAIRSKNILLKIENRLKMVAWSCFSKSSKATEVFRRAVTAFGYASPEIQIRNAFVAWKSMKSSKKIAAMIAVKSSSSILRGAFRSWAEYHAILLGHRDSAATRIQIIRRKQLESCFSQWKSAFSPSGMGTADWQAKLPQQSASARARSFRAWSQVIVFKKWAARQIVRQRALHQRGRLRRMLRAIAGIVRSINAAKASADRRIFRRLCLSAHSRWSVFVSTAQNAARMSLQMAHAMRSRLGIVVVADWFSVVKNRRVATFLAEKKYAALLCSFTRKIFIFWAVCAHNLLQVRNSAINHYVRQNGAHICKIGLFSWVFQIRAARWRQRASLCQRQRANGKNLSRAFHALARECFECSSRRFALRKFGQTLTSMLNAFKVRTVWGTWARLTAREKAYREVCRRKMLTDLRKALSAWESDIFSRRRRLSLVSRHFQHRFKNILTSIISGWLYELNRRKTLKRCYGKIRTKRILLLFLQWATSTSDKVRSQMVLHKAVRYWVRRLFAYSFGRWRSLSIFAGCSRRCASCMIRMGRLPKSPMFFLNMCFRLWKMRRIELDFDTAMRRTADKCYDRNTKRRVLKKLKFFLYANECLIHCLNKAIALKQIRKKLQVTLSWIVLIIQKRLLKRAGQHAVQKRKKSLLSQAYILLYDYSRFRSGFSFISRRNKSVVMARVFSSIRRLLHRSKRLTDISCTLKFRLIAGALEIFRNSLSFARKQKVFLMKCKQRALTRALAKLCRIVHTARKIRQMRRRFALCKALIAFKSLPVGLSDKILGNLLHRNCKIIQKSFFCRWNDFFSHCHGNRIVAILFRKKFRIRKLRFAFLTIRQCKHVFQLGLLEARRKAQGFSRSLLRATFSQLFSFANEQRAANHLSAMSQQFSSTMASALFAKEMRWQNILYRRFFEDAKKRKYLVVWKILFSSFWVRICSFRLWAISPKKAQGRLQRKLLLYWMNSCCIRKRLNSAVIKFLGKLLCRCRSRVFRGWYGAYLEQRKLKIGFMRTSYLVQGKSMSRVFARWLGFHVYLRRKTTSKTLSLQISRVLLANKWEAWYWITCEERLRQALQNVALTHIVCRKRQTILTCMWRKWISQMMYYRRVARLKHVSVHRAAKIVLCWAVHEWNVVAENSRGSSDAFSSLIRRKVLAAQKSSLAAVNFLCRIDGCVQLVNHQRSFRLSHMRVGFNSWIGHDLAKDREAQMIQRFEKMRSKKVTCIRSIACLQKWTFYCRRTSLALASRTVKLQKKAMSVTFKNWLGVCKHVRVLAIRKRKLACRINLQITLNAWFSWQCEIVGVKSINVADFPLNHCCRSIEKKVEGLSFFAWKLQVPRYKIKCCASQRGKTLIFREKMLMRKAEVDSKEKLNTIASQHNIAKNLQYLLKKYSFAAWGFLCAYLRKVQRASCCIYNLNALQSGAFLLRIWKTYAQHKIVSKNRCLRKQQYSLKCFLRQHFTCWFSKSCSSSGFRDLFSFIALKTTAARELKKHSWVSWSLQKNIPVLCERIISLYSCKCRRKFKEFIFHQILIVCINKRQIRKSILRFGRCHCLHLMKITLMKLWFGASVARLLRISSDSKNISADTKRSVRILCNWWSVSYSKQQVYQNARKMQARKKMKHCLQVLTCWKRKSNFLSRFKQFNIGSTYCTMLRMYSLWRLKGKQQCSHRRRLHFFRERVKLDLKRFFWSALCMSRQQHLELAVHIDHRQQLIKCKLETKVLSLWKILIIEPGMLESGFHAGCRTLRSVTISRNICVPVIFCQSRHISKLILSQTWELWKKQWLKRSKLRKRCSKLARSQLMWSFDNLVSLWKNHLFQIKFCKAVFCADFRKGKKTLRSVFGGWKLMRSILCKTSILMDGCCHKKLKQNILLQWMHIIEANRVKRKTHNVLRLKDAANMREICSRLFQEWHLLAVVLKINFRLVVDRFALPSTKNIGLSKMKPAYRVEFMGKLKNQKFLKKLFHFFSAVVQVKKRVDIFRSDSALRYKKTERASVFFAWRTSLEYSIQKSKIHNWLTSSLKRMIVANLYTVFQSWIFIAMDNKSRTRRKAKLVARLHIAYMRDIFRQWNKFLVLDKHWTDTSTGQQVCVSPSTFSRGGAISAFNIKIHLSCDFLGSKAERDIRPTIQEWRRIASFFSYSSRTSRFINERAHRRLLEISLSKWRRSSELLCGYRSLSARVRVRHKAVVLQHSLQHWVIASRMLVESKKMPEAQYSLTELGHNLKLCVFQTGGFIVEHLLHCVSLYARALRLKKLLSIVVTNWANFWRSARSIRKIHRFIRRHFTRWLLVAHCTETCLFGWANVCDKNRSIRVRSARTCRKMRAVSLRKAWRCWSHVVLLKARGRYVKRKALHARRLAVSAKVLETWWYSASRSTWFLMMMERWPSKIRARKRLTLLLLDRKGAAACRLRYSVQIRSNQNLALQSWRLAVTFRHRAANMLFLAKGVSDFKLKTLTFTKWLTLAHKKNRFRCKLQAYIRRHCMGRLKLCWVSWTFQKMRSEGRLQFLGRLEERDEINTDNSRHRSFTKGMILWRYVSLRWYAMDRIVKLKEGASVHRLVKKLALHAWITVKLHAVHLRWALQKAVGSNSGGRLRSAWWAWARCRFFGRLLRRGLQKVATISKRTRLLTALWAWAQFRFNCVRLRRSLMTAVASKGALLQIVWQAWACKRLRSVRQRRFVQKSALVSTRVLLLETWRSWARYRFRTLQLRRGLKILATVGERIRLLGAWLAWARFWSRRLQFCRILDKSAAVSKKTQQQKILCGWMCWAFSGRQNRKALLQHLIHKNNFLITSLWTAWRAVCARKSDAFQLWNRWTALKSRARSKLYLLATSRASQKIKKYTLYNWCAKQGLTRRLRHACRMTQGKRRCSCIALFWCCWLEFRFCRFAARQSLRCVIKSLDSDHVGRVFLSWRCRLTRNCKLAKLASEIRLARIGAIVQSWMDVVAVLRALRRMLHNNGVRLAQRVLWPWMRWFSRTRFVRNTLDLVLCKRCLLAKERHFCSWSLAAMKRRAWAVNVRKLYYYRMRRLLQLWAAEVVSCDYLRRIVVLSASVRRREAAICTILHWHQVLKGRKDWEKATTEKFVCQWRKASAGRHILMRGCFAAIEAVALHGCRIKSKVAHWLRSSICRRTRTVIRLWLGWAMSRQRWASLLRAAEKMALCGNRSVLGGVLTGLHLYVQRRRCLVVTCERAVKRMKTVAIKLTYFGWLATFAQQRLRRAVFQRFSLRNRVRAVVIIFASWSCVTLQLRRRRRRVGTIARNSLQRQIKRSVLLPWLRIALRNVALVANVAALHRRRDIRLLTACCEVVRWYALCRRCRVHAAALVARRRFNYWKQKAFLRLSSATFQSSTLLRVHRQVTRNAAKNLLLVSWHIWARLCYLLRVVMAAEARTARHLLNEAVRRWLASDAAAKVHLRLLIALISKLMMFTFRRRVAGLRMGVWRKAQRLAGALLQCSTSISFPPLANIPLTVTTNDAWATAERGSAVPKRVFGTPLGPASQPVPGDVAQVELARRLTRRHCQRAQMLALRWWAERAAQRAAAAASAGLALTRALWGWRAGWGMGLLQEAVREAAWRAHPALFRPSAPAWAALGPTH